MSAGRQAKVAGVIGWPVTHSLSPRLHGFWLRELGIDGYYVPLPVPRESFALALAGLRAAGFVGVNVTNPHKEAAFAIADIVDDAAKAAGAANLLLFRHELIEAFNTDVDGLSASLAESLGAAAIRGKIVAVLGAGGAARGAILALDRMDAAKIRVVARNPARADTLIAALRAGTHAQLSRALWNDWGKLAGDVALLVNATSGGLAGGTALDIPLDSLPKDAAVCDIVYNPLETKLLKDARTRGHRTVDGLGMLMHQAVPAFAAFYGTVPKVSEDLRTDLEKVLRHGG